jgi:hypothetical protein
VNPFEAEAVVPVRLVSARDGFPWEWSGTAAVEMLCDRLRVKPLLALAVVPAILVRARVGFPCEWLTSAAVVSPLWLAVICDDPLIPHVMPLE